MTSVHAPAGAYQRTITNVGTLTSHTVQRELGSGIRTVFTRNTTNWWCELKLPAHRFTAAWVCCPGETREAALSAAIRQAQTKVRVAA